MNKRKILALLLACFMVVGIMSGCAIEDEDDSTVSSSIGEQANIGSSTGNAEDDDSRASDTISASEIGETATLDVLKVAVQSDPSDWAPFAAAQNGRTVAVNGQSLYQYLFYFLNDGTACSQIGKSYEVAEDQRSISVEIFDYVKDHNGNPVTADDVVFSFEYGLSTGFLTGTAIVDHLEAIDDTHLVIYLTGDPDINTLSTCLSFNIVSQKSMEESDQGMSTWPIGTGRYKLAEYQSGYMWAYEKDEDYWQTDTDYIFSHDFGNVDRIEYYIIAESAQRTIALERGDADYCQEISTDDLPNFMAGGADSENFWTYGIYDNLCLYVYPNMSEGHATTDEKLREAIFYAIDSQSIVDSVFGGLAVTCWDFGSRWVQGFDEDWVDEDTFYQYNVEKAKELVDESSYDGSELVILTEGTNDTSNSATMILAFLNAAGINARIEAVESSILNTYRENPDNWDILVMKFACSQYSAKGYYMSFSESRYPQGTINFIQDDKLQELINTGMRMDWTQEDIQELHDYVIDNAYGYNVCNFVTNYVLSNKIESVCLTSSWSVIPGGCTYAVS